MVFERCRRDCDAVGAQQLQDHTRSKANKAAAPLLGAMRFLRYNTPMHDTVTLGTIATPAGTLGAAWTPDGLGYLALPNTPLTACEAWATRWMPHARQVRDDAPLANLSEQLNAYFAGELRAFNVPLNLRGT